MERPRPVLPKNFALGTFFEVSDLVVSDPRHCGQSRLRVYQRPVLPEISYCEDDDWGVYSLLYFLRAHHIKVINHDPRHARSRVRVTRGRFNRSRDARDAK